MKLDNTKQSQVEDFCKKNDIDLLIIFGSHIKNKQRFNSDLDIAVLKKDKNNQLNKLQLIVQLEVIFQREVDLVILSPNTDPLLRYEIFFSGKPFFEGEPNLFEEEKLKAWKLYIDTKKIRDLRNQSIKQYIRKIKENKT